MEGDAVGWKPAEDLRVRLRPVHVELQLESTGLQQIDRLAQPPQ